jgi:hypothetical protein
MTTSIATRPHHINVVQESAVEVGKSSGERKSEKEAKMLLFEA